MLLAFPVEICGEKFTCRKSPVIPNLIYADLAYHDAVVVEGKTHIRHVMNVYYQYSDKRELKCDFFIEVNRENVGQKMLGVLKNYPYHVCQHHKKRHFFAHAGALMALLGIELDETIKSRDFASREEMASNVITHLSKKAIELLYEKEKDDVKDVPKPPLVGIEENPGPDLVNLTPNFALHGNYVGPGHTGASKLGDVDWSTRPIDALDEAARNHDWHYSQQPANRGAADEILAKRAWRAIAKENSLTGKLKAAFVAAGMKGMSLIGSRNGTLLLDAPPPESVLEENRHKLPKDFISRKRKISQINGNNGSASNTDDVKDWFKSDAALEKEHWALKPVGKAAAKSQINGNNGSATNLDDVAKNKKSKRPKQKQSAAKKQKPPSEGKKGGANNAIVQGFMPSTMNSQSDIKPYYTVTKSTKNSRTIKTLFSVGTVGGTGPTSGGVYLNGGVIFSQVIDKSLFMGQVAEKDFDSYEQWQIKMARRHFLPSVGSNTPGSIWFFPDPDAIDILTLGDTVNPQTLNGHKFAAKHTLWAGLSSGPLNVSKKQLYTDIENIEFSNLNPKYNALSSSENRLYAAGIFTMLNGDGVLATQTTSFGEVFLEFEITFSSSQNADTSKLLLQLKACGRNTNSVQSLINLGSAVAIDPVTLVVSASSSASLNPLIQATEYIYNPNYYNPTTGQYFLPIGTYQIITMMNLSTSPTVSSTVATMTVANGVGTWINQAMYEAGDQFGGTINGPEFSVGYVSAVTSASNGYLLLGLLRITQVTAGNRATVTITMNNTFTGTFSVASIHTMAYRMPEFDTLPLAMFAPIGNGGAAPVLKNKQIRLSSNNPDENPIVVLDGVPPDDEVYYLHKLMREYPHLHSYTTHDSNTQKLEKRYFSERDIKDVLKFQDEEKKVKPIQVPAWDVVDAATSVPDTPEIVDDPLSRSIHLQPNIAARLLNLVGAKAA